LQAGDRIVIIASSGIHANGISLARRLAETLPEGYATRLSDGRLYGEALLDPTILYSALVQELLEAEVPVHYISNVTGHGWRKLMRHPAPFTYRMKAIPPVPPVLAFMQAEARMDAAEAYGSLNMGAGFALFVPPEAVAAVIGTSERLGIAAMEAGRVEEGPKEVIIEPLAVSYAGESLNLRA
jgi:phosphoribosylformylglycinamidine cyclo-ligase